MIKANFTLEGIQEYILQQAQRANKAVLNAYEFAGLEFVRAARLKTSEEGGFRDITGNLRSSIGFIIMVDGVQQTQNFEESGIGTDKATGLSKGITLAEELSEVYPKGVVLICVAGMEYAAAVESKGKDVITGSTLELESRLTTLLSRL